MSGEPRVVSVSISATHVMSKKPIKAITLRVGHGVVGDCHAGATVQHLSRIRRDPTQPNLRQVHLIQRELFDEVTLDGYEVRPGDLGENVTTAGVDLLALPTGTLLRLGDEAEVELTGLRNPCRQINGVHDGLLAHVLRRAPDGAIVRRAGVMGVVRRAGETRAGDLVEIALPRGSFQPLLPV
jgi:MOSC domain-containing protein YiiM